MSKVFLNPDGSPYHRMQNTRGYIPNIEVGVSSDNEPVLQIRVNSGSNTSRQFFHKTTWEGAQALFSSFADLARKEDYPGYFKLLEETFNWDWEKYGKVSIKEKELPSLKNFTLSDLGL